MQRGGLDPRQVPLEGYESRCDKILKELQGLQGGVYIADDAGFESIPNYRSIVPHPVSLGSVKRNVHGKGSGALKKFTYLNDFAREVRRIFGNFLRFNYYPDADTAKLRGTMKNVLFKFESWWLDLQKDIQATQPGMYFVQPLPELRWCLSALEDTLKVTYATISASTVPAERDKHIVHDFMYPITSYILDPVELKKYRGLVKNPTCLGDLVSNLVEGEYSAGGLPQLQAEFDLLVRNCTVYWSQPTKREAGGEELIRGAELLRSTFEGSLAAIKELANISGAGAGKSKSGAGASLALMPRISSGIVPGSGTGGTGNNKSKAVSTAALASPPSAPTLGTIGGGGGGKARPPVATAASNPAPAPVPSSNAAPATSASTASGAGTMSTVAAAALERKVDRLLRAGFKLCLDGMRRHYLVAPLASGGTFRIETAGPFLKAVDPIKFPDYALVVTDPIDLNKIDKRLLSSDRYSSLGPMGGAENAAAALLKDVSLLRDNAHTYNVGKEGEEVRYMVDNLYNYFRYLLKEVLLYIRTHADSAGTVFLIWLKPSAL
jgi:hypothetical protein